MNLAKVGLRVGPADQFLTINCKTVIPRSSLHRFSAIFTSRFKFRLYKKPQNSDLVRSTFSCTMVTTHLFAQTIDITIWSVSLDTSCCSASALTNPPAEVRHKGNYQTQIAYTCAPKMCCGPTNRHVPTASPSRSIVRTCMPNTCMPCMCVCARIWEEQARC